MHHHLEIIMPPADDVESAVKTIMHPFDENNEDRYHAFWDWWVIGGRYAGDKLKAALDENKLDEFYDKLKELKVTVSSVTAGKETLDPASQISNVDALWRDYFPDSGIEVCPLFSHSNDQYSSESLLPGDVCTLAKCPNELTASHLIIAAPNYSNELEAKYMIEQSMWNGVTHIDTGWGGNIKDGLQKHLAKLKNYTDEAAAKYTPKDDWLVVTVDYHS